MGSWWFGNYNYFMTRNKYHWIGKCNQSNLFFKLNSSKFAVKVHIFVCIKYKQLLTMKLNENNYYFHPNGWFMLVSLRACLKRNQYFVVVLFAGVSSQLFILNIYIFAVCSKNTQNKQHRWYWAKRHSHKSVYWTANNKYIQYYRASS